jgi:hypothetical protein
MVWVYKKHKGVNVPIRFKAQWVDVSTDINNITKRSRKIYKVTKHFDFETGKWNGKFNLSFLKTEFRKENLKTKGNHHKLDSQEKAVFRQVIVSLRRKTSIKNISKIFLVSTRTIWKIKGLTRFRPKVNIERIAYVFSLWISAYRALAIDFIQLDKIMSGERPP